MKDVKAFAEELSDAYSTPQYLNGWECCIRMLRRRGYNDLQIETIIRSKWTRWACDASNNAYGQHTSYSNEEREKEIAEMMGDENESTE